MITERTVAEPATTSELTKYRASGTVFQMSKYGWTVSPDGIQWNFPDTSWSGLSELLTIT